MQHWLSAQETADLAKRLDYTGFPTSKKRVIEWAKREEWNANSDLCRKRKGRGGGFEYHISLLPEVLQAGAMAESSQQIVAKDHRETRALQDKRRTALNTTDLTGRQRRVMEARAAILNAIEVRKIHDGSSIRQAVLKFLLMPAEFGVEEAVIVKANDRVNGSAKISRSTIYNWFQARDDIGIGALAPLKTRKKQPIPEWFYDFLHHYARPQKPCITEALAEYHRELKNKRANFLPSYDQVARILRQMDDISKNKGRESVLVLKSRMAYVSRTTEGLLATTIYTADGKTFDAEVEHPISKHPFKPEITSVVDVKTRVCVGFSIGFNEDADGVIDALRHSIEQYGVPAIFYADRGPGFRNKKLEDPITGILERLGITPHHSLPRNSQARGVIERFNGSVWNPLARTYETYLGKEMDQDAAKAVFKRTRKDIEEFGESKILKKWDEFLADCYQAIEEYNASFHRELKSSPNEAWAKEVDAGFEAVMLHPEDADDLLRSYVIRTPRRGLINFYKEKYFSHTLVPYNGRKVVVGYDIHDASKVWVRELENTKSGEQTGRLICVAEINGNAQPYVAESVKEKTEAKRNREALARIEKRRQAKLAEISPGQLIDAYVNEPMEIIEPRQAQPMTIEQNINQSDNVEILVPANKRKSQSFDSDEELAAWAIEHPASLQPSQIKVLRNCLNSPARLEIMEASGIDVERLRDVIRAAA